MLYSKYHTLDSSGKLFPKSVENVESMFGTRIGAGWFPDIGIAAECMGS